jgi:hypothetical protein
MITFSELQKVWEGSGLGHISRYIPDWYGGSKENHENIMIIVVPAEIPNGTSTT